MRQGKQRKELLRTMAKIFKKHHVKQYFSQIKKATFDYKVSKRRSSIDNDLQPNGSMMELKDKVRGMDRALELMYHHKAGKEELDSIRGHLSETTMF